jgi:hypothetical protein
MTDNKRSFTMGWTQKRDPVDDPLAYTTNRYNYDGAQRTYRVLGAARVANTIYMAVRFTENATGKSTVLAAVILISNTRKNGFGYKDMDETMGPSECACPDRIMRLLSPIEDIPDPSCAAAWRARVASYKKTAAEQRTKRASLRPGCVVTLGHAVTFPDGTTATAFRMLFLRGRTPVFEPVDRPGFRCRLAAATLAAATITQADAIAIVA